MDIRQALKFAVTLAVLIIFTSCNRPSNVSDGTGNGSQVLEPEVTQDSARADPQAEELLRTAALEGNLLAVNAFLEQGVLLDAVDEEGHTALMFSAFNGHKEIVKVLLDQGADLDRNDFMGRSALLYASTGPFPETVKILLDKGAKPNIIDSDEHFSPLMHAAAEGNLEVVNLLLEYGADLSLKDIDGDDAESFARQAGHMEVADYLRSVR